jgi:methylated-DNA-[protein]-cysteine S-methyltransferase
MDHKYACFAFSTSLGWMAIEVRDDAIGRLIFGCRTREEAVRSLGGWPAVDAGDAGHPLIDRLRGYADGCPEDFTNVEVDYAFKTGFRRRVLECCRQIPYGETITYGQLARRAGSPNAARAAGQVMAQNRIPIVIPCHRVVATGGGLGGFSAPGGLRTKQRLLALEAESRLLGTPT